MLRLDAGKEVSHRDDFSSLGWEAGVTLRLARWLGFVGGVSIRGSRLPSEEGFALAAGGGADLGGVLRFQIDYILDRVTGIPNHNARISFGVPFPIDLGWRSR